jgi:hypothetical protein
MSIDPRQITSKAEFLEFLESLRTSLAQRPEQWENATLESYLEALGAWIDAFENSYRNKGEPVPTGVNWRFMAEALLAAKIYG